MKHIIICPNCGWTGTMFQANHLTTKEIVNNNWYINPWKNFKFKIEETTNKNEIKRILNLKYADLRLSINEQLKFYIPNNKMKKWNGSICPSCGYIYTIYHNLNEK